MRELFADRVAGRPAAEELLDDRRARRGATPDGMQHLLSRARWDTDGDDPRHAPERHTVWYEDARSIDTKQQVAIRNRLRGLAIWRIGGEDPQLWTAVAHATAGSAP